MKIVLLKDHNGDREGSIHDVTEELANYLVRCKVAKYVTAADPKPDKKTKELKTNLDTK